MTTAAIRVIDINDGASDVVARDLFSEAERVHRQLRPHMPTDYAAAMARLFFRQRPHVRGRAPIVASGVAVGHALMEHLQALARYSCLGEAWPVIRRDRVGGANCFPPGRRVARHTRSTQGRIASKRTSSTFAKGWS